MIGLSNFSSSLAPHFTELYQQRCACKSRANFRSILTKVPNWLQTFSASKGHQPFWLSTGKIPHRWRSLSRFFSSFLVRFLFLLAPLRAASDARLSGSRFRGGFSLLPQSVLFLILDSQNGNEMKKIHKRR